MATWGWLNYTAELNKSKAGVAPLFDRKVP